MKRTTTGLLLAAALALPASMLPTSAASAAVNVGVSVNFGPPSLPWYPQPICPGYGYYWVPGYWAYARYGYFWVPGAWVWPPMVGFLWTPGYWGWRGGYYYWNAGYWGPRVGFYGGIYYGYGYPGRGYYGGRWRHGHFYYNRSVTNVDANKIHLTYNKPVAAPHKDNHISYNGGKGGIALRPTKEQQAWASKPHTGPTANQAKLRETAMNDPAMRFKNNRGKPAASGKPSGRPLVPGKLQPGVARPEPKIDSRKPGNKPMVPMRKPENRPIAPSPRPVRHDQGKLHKKPPTPPRVNTPPPMRMTPTQAPRQVRQPPKNTHRAAPPHPNQHEKKKGDKGPPP